MGGLGHKWVGFRGYLGHFLCFGGILVIFRFWGYFGPFFFCFGGILVIFKFRGYFGHFLGFGGIFVIFRFRGYFGHLMVLGYFGYFLGWSFSYFLGDLSQRFR